jgi:hypothetical protein
MLLDRIEELERRLHDRENMAAPTAPPEPPTERPLPDPDEQPDLALEDTQPIGLRDRLRLATGRIHQQ